MSFPDPEKCQNSTQEASATDAYSVTESLSSEGTDDANDANALGATLTARASRLSEPLSMSHRMTSIGTTGTADPQFEVDWENEDDPGHPKNSSMKYRSMAIFFLSWNTLIM